MIKSDYINIGHTEAGTSWSRRVKEGVPRYTDKLIPLDYRNRKHVYATARLHQELLGVSPIPQLGYEFMIKFYYSKLVQDELIKCDLYQNGQEFVGFLVYTKYPFTFMETGKRRYFLYLCLLLLKAVFSHPYRLKAIFKAIRFGQKRQQEKDDQKTGELLSFGVLEPYCKIKDKATGLRISNLLFERALIYFKNEGFKRVQGEVSKDNYPTLFFWRSYGASIKDYSWGKENNYLVSIEL